MKIKLMEDMITDEEIDAVMECMKSGFYTQGKKVEEFEEKFAIWNGSKYAVMINSGSSANLLMVYMLKHKYGLTDGDEVIVPAVTWPTTIYPVIQNGLSPVFCDVDSGFNLSLDSLKTMVSERTKAVFLVHLLGQPAKLSEIKSFCDEKGLILIEDCCESLGTKVGGVKVGNVGEMGSFSFYFGHHMTTIEGGMIVTNDKELHDLLKSARSHGWIRGSVRSDRYPEYKHKDFVFDMLGYNFRSTNMNAVIGLVQLKKLQASIEKRIENHKYFLGKIKGMGLEPQKVDFDETSSFSLALLFDSEAKRDFVMEYIIEKGIESRPVVAGNLLRQPVFKDHGYRSDELATSDKIHDRGIYLPNNQFIDKEKVDYIVDSIKEALDKYDKSN